MIKQTNLKVNDFRLPPQYKLDLCHSGILPGLVQYETTISITCNQHVTECKSKTEQNMYLTTSTNTPVSSLAITGRNTGPDADRF